MSPARSISLPSAATRAKLRRRILPFVFLLYITSYLDRANVAFAKMPMSADLGFSEAVYGFGAGIFFLGYLLFGIPGAMLIERSSARKWIARMLVVWGCCTVLVGFVRTPGEFYAARFALGCAEAGFFPGIIIYFSHWFALKDRARAMAGFIMAIPVSLMLGAPFSALILNIHWLGLPGWRWVFILQGLAPVAFGVTTYFYLTDYPRDAKWLDPEEREQITAELEAENRLKVKHEKVSLWQVLRYKNVLLLALALCTANIGSYAFVLWLPTIIRNSSHLSVSISTACSALPFVAGLIAVRLAGRSSDRSGERRLHTAIPLIVTGIFFTLSSIPGQPFPLVLLWLCLTGAAAYSWPPPFWVLPTATLAASAAAVSVGLINAIGNLGGFVGPTVVGYLLSLNYSYTVAIAFLSACFGLAGLLILTLRVPRAGALVVVLSLCLYTPARAEDALRITKQTILVPMRDGVKLAADVYLPELAKKRPVLLMRTPYNKAPIEAVARRYAQAGYSVVVQDCRGRYASDGVFFPYNNEGQDGFDTLEWITASPWSDGRVGMWGASYVGAVQWQAAAEKAPGITVLAPTATWSSFYRNVYTGGAVRLALIAQAAASLVPPPAGIQPPGNWADTLLHLPLAGMDQAIGWPLPWLTGILAHPNPDGYWKRLDITREVEGMNIPAQHIVGYYDFFSREVVGNFHRMKSRLRQQLILGPWDHGTIGKSKVGDVDFGSVAQIDLAGENLTWFNRFLQAGSHDFPAVRYFSMGDNTWRAARTWPPENSKSTSFYLRSAGKANTRKGDGRLTTEPPDGAEPPDTLQADPADPAPAIPESTLHPKYSATWGPVDQGAIADRPDVLVYSTKPMTRPLTFAGPIRAELQVSADTPDSDWVVRLIDVRPDGFAQNLAVGILRGSARESELNRKPMEPGKTYKISVDVGSTAATILPGHSLRVDLSAAYFPLFERNANTGEGPAGARTQVATQKILHSRAAMSRIQLPVMLEDGNRQGKKR